MMPTLRPLRTLALPVALLVVAGCRAPFEPYPDTITPPPPPTNGPLLPFRLGSTGPDFARAVAVDGSGSAYVASYFAGTVDFDPSSTSVSHIAKGASDIAVSKYTADGSLAWSYQIGGTDTDVPFDIKTGPGGVIYVTGYLSAGAVCSGLAVPNAGGQDIFLMQLSSAGTCNWVVAVGSSGDDEGHALVVEPSGNVVVTGTFTNTVDFDPGSGAALLVSRGGADGFVARYGSDGSFLNVVQFGGLGDDAGNAIVRTTEGDFILGGEFSDAATFGSALAPLVLTSAGDKDFFIARLAPQLGLQWGIRGGGSGPDAIGQNGLVLDDFGSILATGTFSGVADFDPSTAAVLLTSRGGTDVFVARYDPTGVLAGLTEGFGGSGSEGVDGFARDAEGNLYLAGWFQGSVDFDPGSDTHIVVGKGTGGAGDAYLLSLDGGGAFRWVHPVGAVIDGDANLSIAAGLALQADGRLWAVGRFFGTVTWDLTQPTLQTLSLGDADQFVLRLLTSDGTLDR